MGLWHHFFRRTFAVEFKLKSELIKQLLVENPEMVSVQVNEEFAEREDWDSVQIKEGDKVDFLYFMGGGAR